MAAPIWITPAGNLGIIPDEEYYQLELKVFSPDSPITYSLVAGKLPTGLHIDQNGNVAGVPIRGLVEGVPAAITEVTTSGFTIRATNQTGQITDRTFELTVTGVNPPEIVPKNTSLGEFFSGSLVQIQLRAVEFVAGTTLKWKVSTGQLPPGLSLSESGLLQGFITPELSASLGLTVPPGFDNLPYDKYPFQFAGSYEDKNYQFTVSVTDGFTSDISEYTIFVKNKSGINSGSTTITADNISIASADLESKNSPILRNLDITLEPARQGGYYSHKFDGHDYDGDDIVYSISSGILPPLLEISPTTGWVTGLIAPGPLGEVNYEFTVRVSKADPAYSGYFTERKFILPILGRLENTVIWDTASDLGYIDNGDISSLVISAHTTTSRNLQYKLAFTNSAVDNFTGSRLPQGLKLLPDGNISGRVSFELFTVDGGTTTFDSIKTETTYDTEYRFNIEAYIPGVYDLSHRGDDSTLEFSIPNVGAVTQQTRVMINNIILTPGKDFTVSNEKLILVAAPAVNDIITIKIFVNYVSDIKEFVVKVNLAHKKPYENLYIKALPPIEQRHLFNQIINNSDIFPVGDIYRPSDPWFGKNTNLKCLFLTGINPHHIRDYVAAMELNHYWKNITFGEIRTARALDQNFNTKYEVVYLTLNDNSVNEHGESISPNVTISSRHGKISTNYFPNSFDNMVGRLIDGNSNPDFGAVSEGLGYASKSILPEWMTSRQPDGSVLGFTRALVLCYTKPGKCEAIAYRARKVIDSLRLVDFTVDRYELDHLLTKNYTIGSGVYQTSGETIFDHRGFSGASGTISTNSNLLTVNGSGTLFTSELSEDTPAYAVVPPWKLWRTPVRLASTTDMPVLASTGSPVYVDGILVEFGDRVLIKSQIDLTENGVYTVSPGTWIRSSDANQASKLIGTHFKVLEGAVNSGKVFKSMVTDPAAVIGAVTITWEEVLAGGVTSNTSSNVVRGDQSSFTSELKVDQLLIANNFYQDRDGIVDHRVILGRIIEIIDDETLVLDQLATETVVNKPYASTYPLGKVGAIVNNAHLLLSTAPGITTVGSSYGGGITAPTTYDRGQTRFFGKLITHAVDPEQGQEYIKFPNNAITARTLSSQTL